MSTDLIDARALFGDDHDGYAHCICVDDEHGVIDDRPNRPVAFGHGDLVEVTINGRQYISDRVIAIRHELLDLHDVPVPQQYASSMSWDAPDVSLVGGLVALADVAFAPHTATRVHEAGLTVHRCPSEPATGRQYLALDGLHAGWLMAAREGITWRDVPRVSAIAATTGVSPQATASVLTEAGVIPVINHPRED